MALETVLAKAREQLTGLFGDNLICAAVYGSAAGNDYHEGLSDVNLVLVVKKLDLDALDCVTRFQRQMRGVKLSMPLMMTKEHIETSLDVFPIEFLEIRERHKILLGEDYFNNLTIDTRNLRHECEHELKGRIIRLRQSYMEVGRKRGSLRHLLVSAHSANFPAFRAAIRLKNGQPSLGKEDIEGQLQQHFGLNPKPFHQIRLLRAGHLKQDSLADLRQLLDNYLVEVEKLAQAVDQL
jgi:predicted nucleotidyltransferase